MYRLSRSLENNSKKGEVVCGVAAADSLHCGTVDVEPESASRVINIIVKVGGCMRDEIFPAGY